MIFVTVGTHEQQFNRLIKEVDRLKMKEIIKEKVFIQTGYSDYIPRFCDSSDFLTYVEMERYIDEANLVITHGGPASFLSVMAKNKPLIVVPRKTEFNEHVNDHQLDFIVKINQLGIDIKFVDEIDSLEKQVAFAANESNFLSNNDKFNEEFRKQVNSMFS